MEPFCHLLKSGTLFCWSPILQEKFEMARQKIVDAVTEGVERFDMKRKTCLATDWSNSGIGFFLMQKYCSCEISIVVNFVNVLNIINVINFINIINVVNNVLGV